MQATAKWSGPGSEQSASSSRIESASQCWEPDPRYPSWPAVMRRNRKAEYMTAPDQSPTPAKALAQRGPSIHDGALASIWSEIAPENRMGPDALGVAGPCLAPRETSGMLQMISRRRKRLAFASAAKHVWSAILQSALPLRHVERGQRFDPGHARVIPFGPAESWLPRLSAAPSSSAGGCVAFALPVHDDAMTLSPEGCGCQIKFRPLENGRSRQNEALIRSRLRRPRSPSC